jgi:hypothetical protein
MPVLMVVLTAVIVAGAGFLAWNQARTLQLVITVMGRRGYPAGDFEVRLAVLSVEHARALDHYRNGHEISVRAQASTEDLRQAMVHYRAVVGDLLSAEVPALSGRPRGDE